MQMGIFKVCLVVATAVINHPLFFQKENATLPESDDDIITRMKEHEEHLKMEMLRLEQDLHKMDEERHQNPEQGPRNEENPIWDLWSAMSLIIFLIIEIWRQELQDEASHESSNEEDDLTVAGNFSQKVALPDKIVLASFHEKCIRISNNDLSRTKEFVEGFADDLLEALRSVCNRDADMEVEDCIGIGSLYESWRVHKPLLCDLIVPFAPPEPYRFKAQVCFSGNGVPPDKQGCGKIKVIQGNEDVAGCVCGKTNLGEDMLCLLHSNNERSLNSSVMEDLLCSKGTQYLNTGQVMKWFQIAVTKAWNKISHKYDFELTFRNLDSPGALKIKFRSGKVIVFNITPVVQFEDSDVYFVSHFANDALLDDCSSDIYWSLSFAVYERRLLKSLAKKLPENSCHLSCLQIVSFLHRKQCNLTGRSGLNNYHLKTVLLHLLFSRPFSDWGFENLEVRLRDMLRYLEKSLQEKRLSHSLIGNRFIPADICLPLVFQKAEPPNLFRPLVLERAAYKKTVDTFYEMLKNAAVLIKEYTLHLPNGHLDMNMSLNTS
uniref:Inositol 1,4,5-trisphosphate receptor-interacting protein n=2 Tax=Latimeria chalumnae TaxID=7897 RepID=H3AAC0_LATCH